MGSVNRGSDRLNKRIHRVDRMVSLFFWCKMRALCCFWLMLAAAVLVFCNIHVRGRDVRAPLQRLRYPSAGYVRANSAGCKIGRVKSYENQDVNVESEIADWKLARKNLAGREIQDETKIQDVAEDSAGLSVYQENKEYRVKPRNRWRMIYGPKNDSIKID